MKIKNPRVVVYSIIALGFLAMAFFVHWMWIIGAVILGGLNQKELMSPSKHHKSKKKTQKQANKS